MTVKRMDNMGIVVQLCCIRGPEGILIGLAQQLDPQDSRADPMERKG